MKLLYVILLIASSNSNAADFTVSKSTKNSYNIYDWNTGNTYYGQYNGKRTVKLYPKTIVNDEAIVAPGSYTVKGPYDGSPYDD